jgi:hypothetical protein
MNLHLIPRMTIPTRRRNHDYEGAPDHGALLHVENVSPKEAIVLNALFPDHLRSPTVRCETIRGGEGNPGMEKIRKVCRGEGLFVKSVTYSLLFSRLIHF